MEEKAATAQSHAESGAELPGTRQRQMVELVQFLVVAQTFVMLH